MILFPSPTDLLAAAYFSLVTEGKAPAPDDDMRPLLAKAEAHLVAFRDILIMQMAERTTAKLPPERLLHIWPKVYDTLIEHQTDEVWLNPDDPEEVEGIPLACAYGLASLRWLNWLARGRVPDYVELNSDYAADFISCRRYLPLAPEWWLARYHKPVQARLI